MDYKDFRKQMLKLNEKRHHKIKNSYGIKEIYKRNCKTGWKTIGKQVSEHDLSLIVRTVNNLIAEELRQGNSVRLPQRMGQLDVRKINNTVTLINGKIKTSRRINWDATLKLWNEDDEAKENKVLVRVENKESFIVFYNRMATNYKNKSLISFKPNRELGIAIQKKGQNGLIDAYTIGK